MSSRYDQRHSGVPGYGYFTAMDKCFRLDGRSPRREFWLFQLAVLIVSIAALTLDYQVIPFILPEAIIDLFGRFSAFVQSAPGMAIFVFDPSREVLFTFSMMVHLVPGLTVTIRRMHDIGMSGWWLLVTLVPIIGLVVFIVWMVRKSEAGNSGYGPNPYSLAR